MAFTEANTVALSESKITLSFPAEDSVKNKIPLWMKFYCFEYSNTAATRAMSNNTVGGFFSNLPAAILKAQICIPAPVNFETTTTHIYQNQKTSAQTTLPPGIGGLIDKLLPQFSAAISVVQGGLEVFRDWVNQQSASYLGVGSDIPTDDNDAVFVPSGPSRIYEIKVFLPCLSARDSEAAGAIARAFEALSLPTLTSLLSLSSTKMFHPPLWTFGIGGLETGKMDADWSGQPLLCALMTVKTKKVAFDTNSLAAVDANFKPVGYAISLIFKEIEPAVRLTNGAFFGTSTSISNRSGAIVRGGLNVL